MREERKGKKRPRFRVKRWCVRTRHLFLQAVPSPCCSVGSLPSRKRQSSPSRPRRSVNVHEEQCTSRVRDVQYVPSFGRSKLTAVRMAFRASTRLLKTCPAATASAIFSDHLRVASHLHWTQNEVDRFNPKHSGKGISVTVECSRLLHRPPEHLCHRVSARCSVGVSRAMCAARWV